MGKHEPVEFYGQVRHETDLAYLVHDGQDEVWIAKSQLIEKPRQVGRFAGDYEFIIPEWVAKEKGII